MVMAQAAFHNSDLDLKDTLAIDVKWKIYSERQKEHKMQSLMIRIDEQERHEKESYRYFKDLYNKELRLLHISQNPRKTKARAFEATAMDDWRSNVEHNLNQMNMGQEDLVTALSAAMRDNMSISGATTHPGGSIAIPSAITAESSLTNVRYKQMEDKLIDAMHTALQTKSQTTYEQRPNSYDQRPKTWSIEILSPNKTQELHTKSRGSQIANIAYIANIANIANTANTATTIIPKITFTSFSCPFKPNTIRMSSQPE
jgi:hypothetical protein